jgi:uncharacterized protein YvpB
MIIAILLIGTVLLANVILLLNKFRQFKLVSYIRIAITLFLFSYLLPLITVNEKEKKVIKQITVTDRPQLVTTADEIYEDPVTLVKIKDKVLLDAPVIKQFPELPRGCEVTSLAMLLQYKGIQTDKMELAAKIKKDDTPLRKENGIIYWGSPYNGFIGDMYTYNNPGYGVYHRPIKDLAEQFLPGQIVDLTGSEFTELKIFLSLDIPIWIITNTTYKNLSESFFKSWQTPDGEIKITYKEHSVLVTGYDEKNIYFNDPLNGEKNKAVLIDDFIDAWKQMGSQAVTYLPEQDIGSK